VLPDQVCVPAKAGSIVCFSSLTPHMTGPNTTDGIRKAYICQYARDGAPPLARSLQLGGVAGLFGTQTSPPWRIHGAGVCAVGSEDGTLATRTASPADDPHRQCAHVLSLPSRCLSPLPRLIKSEALPRRIKSRLSKVRTRCTESEASDSLCCVCFWRRLRAEGRAARGAAGQAVAAGGGRRRGGGE